MLLIALSTVDRPSLCGLEWYFTFFAAVGTNGLMHRSRSVKISVTHFPHFFSFVIHQFSEMMYTHRCT
jgi:hypothetical protein